MTRLPIEAGALAFLPAAAFELIPELADLDSRGLTDEAMADCERCVKLPERHDGGLDHPWAFDPTTRCCTFHPTLPNYLVGRALGRGGPGAERMRARLTDPTGVTAWGIAPSDDYEERKRRSRLSWGRDPTLLCPFFIGGPRSCSIWPDRNAVCRTWFCKHGGGVVALQRWNALRQLLTALERGLAGLCVERGEPPGPDAASTRWYEWFAWCADTVEHLRAADLAALRTPGLAARREQLAGRMDRVGPEPLDVLVPAVRNRFVHRGRLALEGYSNYDGAEAPAEILALFARLDGVRGWPEALAELRSQGVEEVTEASIRELRRIDVLRDPARVRAEAAEDGKALPPGDHAEPPAVLVPATQRPIAIGGHVWLQGEVPLGSVLAPTSIFRFLARLDGHAAWRPALAAANRECRAEGLPVIAEDTIVALYRIGALQAAGPDAAPAAPPGPQPE